MVERVNHKARQQLWSELVKLELEGGDDSEIAAAAAERPEQIRVFFRGRMHQVAVRRAVSLLIRRWWRRRLPSCRHAGP
jgi:hypothetical protein